MDRNQIVRTAHRGASVHYPENTLLAFRRAIEQSVDALEIDIQRTADRELVVIHDSTLEPTTNGHGNVADHSFQGIRQLDAGQGERVPHLREVIPLAREAHLRFSLSHTGNCCRMPIDRTGSVALGPG